MNRICGNCPMCHPASQWDGRLHRMEGGGESWLCFGLKLCMHREAKEYYAWISCEDSGYRDRSGSEGIGQVCNVRIAGCRVRRGGWDTICD